MKKFFRKVHLWISVPFGVIISIIFLTGGILAFEQEINEITRSKEYFVTPVNEKPLPMPELIAKVSASLPDSISVTGVTISANPKKSYQVNLSKPRRASVLVNQYTGEILGRGDRTPFFGFIFRLHRWLLNPAPQGAQTSVGKMLVGISTIIFVFAIITGIVIWWPKSKKMLKNRLSVKTNKGWWRFWYDLHLSGGIYVTIILLIMALTGLTWSFSWYREGFYKVFGVEMQQMGPAPQTGNQPGGQPGGQPGEQKSHQGNVHEGKGARRGGGNPYIRWDNVVFELKQKNPEFRSITVSDGKASVSVNKYGNQRASDSYNFNSRTGEITDISLYKDQPDSSKMRGWIYSVHVGNWGGLLTKIIYFIACIIGASLPVTGYYLWIKRITKKNKK